MKVRLVADLVRGMDCNEAVSVLEFTNKRGAYFIGRLLKSVMANASNYNLDHNTDYNVENMFISDLRVDEGPRLKRWRAAPMGRGVPILRRLTHISIGICEHIATEEDVEDITPDEGTQVDEAKVKTNRKSKKNAAASEPEEVTPPATETEARSGDADVEVEPQEEVKE